MPKSIPDAPGLVRTIGRWSLVALMVNSIVGSGIFGLPSVIAGLTGYYSPWAVLLGGAAIGVIVACWAEVASQFSEGGGPYLYARTAFGRLAGLEVGWLLWLAQLAAPAASANLFVIYLAEFWPHARDPLPRSVILTLLVAVVALVNYRGVNGGTRFSDVFTVAKLLPLFSVALAGSICVLASHYEFSASPSMAARSLPAAGWLKATLLLVFAYGGFETALVPMGEAKDPRRDTVFALFVAWLSCTLLYTLIQWVVIRLVFDAAHSQRPLADAAGVSMGRGGSGIVAAGALICCYGYLAAKTLAVPRLTLALAQGNDFPSFLAAIHPRFRTPYVSIGVFAALVWGLSLLGSFSWNLTLSAVARLLYYAVGCAALPVLRRKNPGGARFLLPAGNYLAALGVLICLLLITQVDLGKSLIVAGTLIAALLHWIWVSKQGPRSWKAGIQPDRSP